MPDNTPPFPLSEAALRTVVDTFYDRIRQDDLLGPVFDNAIGDHWPEHLDKLTRFWCSVMLSAGTYRGNPMAAHLVLPHIEYAHLDRWLSLWRQTTNELLEQSAALQMQAKANMMGHRILETFLQYQELAAANA